MPRLKDDGTSIRGFRHFIDSHDEPLRIIALADLHIGDPNCNMRLIRDLINQIKGDRNLYTVLVGDLLNSAIVGSRSDSYQETMKPSEQLAICGELLEPIKDKVLAICGGNHEARINRAVGISVTELLARELNLHDVYTEEAALVFITTGRDAIHCRPITYSMYISHGHGGGGRRVGSKLNALQDYASIIDADCFIVGHTHMPASFKQQTFRINNASGTAILHEQLFVNTAAALNYGGYGKQGGYQPGSQSYPIITLDNHRHHLSATV